MAGDKNGGILAGGYLFKLWGLPAAHRILAHGQAENRARGRHHASPPPSPPSGPAIPEPIESRSVPVAPMLYACTLWLVGRRAESNVFRIPVTCTCPTPSSPQLSSNRLVCSMGARLPPLECSGSWDRSGRFSTTSPSWAIQTFDLKTPDARTNRRPKRCCSPPAPTGMAHDLVAPLRTPEHPPPSTPAHRGSASCRGLSKVDNPAPQVHGRDRGRGRGAKAQPSSAPLREPQDGHGGVLKTQVSAA